ncbi:MAG: pantoate--beta-alanine ligase [Deltaproteobacteria bacterium]|nr:pantoate--beta-alanine ligase [Deltaproteobacteria bacterium]
MEILSTPAAMTAWSQRARSGGMTVGLVPTMGFLHDGHLSLMRQLRSRVDRLVVSIYVNPLQFGPSEDLSSYPRDREGDLAKCASVGVDAVFVPEDLYPDGFSTLVSVNGLTEHLCGASRPGHFDGVCTVVARLFGVVRPDEAVFGEKDFQQLMVIRRMVEDLALPVRVLPGALMRDPDGLAMSSRNTYLSAEDRARALSIHRALGAMQAAEAAGERRVSALRSLGRAALDVDRLDYLEVVDALTLAPVDRVDGPARVAIAAWVGRPRLIDNMPLGPSLRWI